MHYLKNLMRGDMRGENKDDVVMKRLEEEIKNMSLEKKTNFRSD